MELIVYLRFMNVNFIRIEMKNIVQRENKNCWEQIIKKKLKHIGSALFMK